MTRDVYACWAPSDSIWSPWVKPVLFADEVLLKPRVDFTPTPKYPLDRFPEASRDTFVIVDRPGSEAVVLGIELARRGYRPIPLFNGVDGEPAVVPVGAIVNHLVQGAAELQSLILPPDAPPAFLLDSNRLDGPALARMFDNRWVAVPEDFPSANRLLAAGLRRCVMLLELPLSDLPHVLLRFRSAGIELLEFGRDGSMATHVPKRPSSFGMLFARALVLAGFRRSSAGGFGGLVPEPSEGGYG